MSEKLSKYVIEREVPNAGNLSPKELQGDFEEILRCVEEPGAGDSVDPELCDAEQDLLRYLAPNEELIRKHAGVGGFPVIWICGSAVERLIRQSAG